MKHARIARLVLGLSFSALTLAGLPARTIAGDLITVASFNGANGGSPFGGVTLDASGNIYGTTSNMGPGGGGTVFEINHGFSTINTLGSFSTADFSDPNAPRGTLALYNGALYGTTSAGGDAHAGVVYSVPLQGGTPSVIASVPYSYPGPNPGVVIDSQGNIYGSSVGGGATNAGAVWEITQGSHNLTTLASFNIAAGLGGSLVPSSVTIDGNGNIFGTTLLGGANQAGTVWEIAKGSSTVTLLASFSASLKPGDTLVFPSQVVVDSQGNIYGTTGSSGGAYGTGSVWELDKGSSTIETLASFSGATEDTPKYGVSVDSHGNLYGETYSGGIYTEGTLFEVVAGSHTITELAAFGAAGGGGEYPLGSVAIDAQGNLFGTTSFGGTVVGSGTVWEYTASVPEPSSIVLSMIGLAATWCVVLIRRRRIVS